MAVERQTFFDIMASFPSGVAIVTTLTQAGEPRGLTSTAVASVSAHPPLILVCVDLSSRTLGALRERGRFAVNFIRQGRSELCLLFASKADDKFRRLVWRPSATGLPLLHEDALAWAECETVREVAAGDHVILLGRVDAGEAQRDAEAPLMYYRRSWGVWTPAQERGPAEELPPLEVSGRDLRWTDADA